MKKYRLLITTVTAIAFFAIFQSCSTDPVYYSQVVPETFFDSQDKVYQRMGRPFTHWSWYVADEQAQSVGYRLQEFTTDEIVNPARYNDWYDGGRYIRLYQHEFVPSDPDMWDVWRGFSMGYAQALSAKDDIEQYVDFDKLNFPAGSRDAILMQLQTLAAYFALQGLDQFGGIPLYISNIEEPKARATDVETFEHIEKLLKEALVSLPEKNEPGVAETGNINAAAAAVMLARLYFNAVPYIRQDKLAECAAVCEDLLGGVYGAYELDDDWRDIFGYGNETSPEIIWTCASEPISMRSENSNTYHYRFDRYWGNANVDSRNNGYCLTPSLDANGKSYLSGSSDPSPKGTYKLGSPFAKFHEKDVRKQLHAFNPADQTWRGMFYFGELINPYTGAQCVGGDRQFNDKQVMVMVDQIARISEWSQANAATDHGREGVRWAEENSGVRLGKFSPVPTLEYNALLGTPDIPIYRLAEVYYMLAECKMRAGDKEGAAQLINEVRQRYFPEGDPDPVTVANLDEWRMLDEWMLEFVSEGRRRMDLVRWDKFTTESWWDHPADGAANAHKNRFPIPEQAMNGNNLLEQNPGYN